MTKEISLQFTGKPKTDVALVEELIARVSEHLRAEPHEGTITVAVSRD
jgi:hypothetical protein